jgi:hypothetical protein
MAQAIEGAGLSVDISQSTFDLLKEKGLLINETFISVRKIVNT